MRTIEDVHTYVIPSMRDVLTVKKPAPSVRTIVGDGEDHISMQPSFKIASATLAYELR